MHKDRFYERAIVCPVFRTISETQQRLSVREVTLSSDALVPEEQPVVKHKQTCFIFQAQGQTQVIVHDVGRRQEGSVCGNSINTGMKPKIRKKADNHKM